MSISKATAATAAVIASLAMVTFSGTAQATPKGGPVSEVTPQSCIHASGGEWCQGRTTVMPGVQLCWSDYFHPTKYHSSTVQLAGDSQKSYNKAGEWSAASLKGGQAYRCYTYYDDDATL